MNLRTALTVLFATLIPLQSFARDYSVEAIIFTNAVPVERPAEQWDDKAPRNIKAQNKLDRLYQQAVEATQAREEAIENKAANVTAQAEITTTTETPESADLSNDEQVIKTIISSDLLELQAIADTLEESPDHDILQTLSWNQSEADYNTSPLINTLTSHMKGVIRVYAPNLLFAEVNLTYVPDEILPESLLENEDEPEDIPAPVFDTPYTSTDYGSDYLLEPVPEPVIVHYFMDEQRKLKLNEIHYFDHSRFGVILSVKPIQEPAPQSS
ncbi:MAG: hypothetical protein GY726_01215 [Proteobacteria bacterium]|nr:hypothetical protein [Pseudomonadota bacterium]